MPLYVKFVIGYLVIGGALAFYMSVRSRVDKPDAIGSFQDASNISSATQFLFLACWPVWWPLWLRERRKHLNESKESGQPPVPPGDKQL